MDQPDLLDSWLDGDDTPERGMRPGVSRGKEPLSGWIDMFCR